MQNIKQTAYLVLGATFLGYFFAKRKLKQKLPWLKRD